MFQSSDSSKSNTPAHNANSYTPSMVSIPVEQATIGRTLVFKGEIGGSESLYIDGCVEGKITLPQNRVTIGRNGKAAANIQALEVVVMGTVTGNIDCGDRVEIRSEGSVTGDISTVRISVEDGAAIKGGIHVKSDAKASGTQNKPDQEQARAMPAGA
jgi:cytoskeletal protein CcmA (bactofilin family)